MAEILNFSNALGVSRLNFGEDIQDTLEKLSLNIDIDLSLYPVLNFKFDIDYRKGKNIAKFFRCEVVDKNTNKLLGRYSTSVLPEKEESKDLLIDTRGINQDSRAKAYLYVEKIQEDFIHKGIKNLTLFVGREYD